MKKIAVIFLLSMVMVACNDKNVAKGPVALVGSWKLIEVVADPGDGSGTFQPATGDKTIEFLDNGKVIASSSLCYDQDSKSGIYTASNGLIEPEGCQAKIFYVIEDNYLILSLPCIESCQEKYSKLERTND